MGADRLIGAIAVWGQEKWIEKLMVKTINRSFIEEDYA